MLNNEDLSRITKCIAARITDVQAIYLFGSMARGEELPDSDIDLAIIAESPLTPELVFNLKSDLSLELRRDIDILDLRSSSLEIAFQAIMESQCLFGSEHPDIALFETAIMSMYANFQLERKEIVADILGRGNIYEHH
jgi:predicted nucleotidyltransferase